MAVDPGQFKGLSNILAGLNISGDIPGGTESAPQKPKVSRHFNKSQFPREFNLSETGGGKHARPYPPDTHGNPYPSVNFRGIHEPAGRHGKPYDVKADISASLGTQFSPKGKHQLKPVNNAAFPSAVMSPKTINSSTLSASGQPVSFPRQVSAKQSTSPQAKAWAKYNAPAMSKNKMAGGKVIPIRPSKHEGKLADTLRQVTSAA